MKKNKSGFLLIKGEVWPYSVIVCLGVEKQHILDYGNIKFIKPFTIKDEEKLEMKGHGLTLRLENRAFVLWLKKFPKTPEEFGYLSHEIFHVADMILFHAGMTLSPDSDEAWAYLIDWYTKKIYTEFKLV